MAVVGTINMYPPPAAGWEVVHVDASARGIWDESLGRNVPVDIVTDMRALTFADGTVDRVQCWHALEHVNEQGGRDAIKEFARVLTTDGVLDLRVPDLGYIRQADSVERVLHLIYGDQTYMPDSDLNVHRWGYTIRSLTRLLADHGFECEMQHPEYPDEIHVLGHRS